MKEIFVFTTDTVGQHSKGAAKTAYKKHGARWGMAYGQYGNSFAIPVKNQDGQYIKESYIDGFVEGFVNYAAINPQWDFYIKCVDHLDPNQFRNATGNVLFPEEWRYCLGDTYNYWS